MAKFKIVFCFSDTGGGHRSAVDAIEAAIRELIAVDSRGHEFELACENIVEQTHPINRAFVDFYNYLLRHNQQAMKYYHWLIQLLKPNDSALCYKLCSPVLEKLLTKLEPQVIVSVHPMCSHYLARAMRQLGLIGKAKLITVVTDPNGELWKGWACKQADLTLVPNQLAGNKLIEWGVNPSKVRAVGMPVHPDFIKAPSTGKQEFLHHLGLCRDRLTVCINAGWAGGGNMITLYRQLEHVKRPIQVVFLCGHNRALYDLAKREARKGSIPTAVLPFHDKMSDLMNAVDLMVTKAGGVTTFEAIARKLPLAFDALTEPMPQEIGTVKFLVQNGLASEIRKPKDLCKVIENLTVEPDRSLVKLPSAYCLDRSSAVYDIARTIIGICDPLYQPLSEQGTAAERRS